MRTGDCRQLRQEQWSGVPASPAPPGDPVSAPLRAAGLVLLAAHLALVGWFSLRPVPAAWVYDANLRPLASIHRALAAGTAEDYRRLATSLLMMAPLGVLLPLAGGLAGGRWLPSLLRTTGGAALICTGLEFLQSYVPGHVVDVDDVLLNLLGVTLVHLAVVPGARVLIRHRAEHRPPGAVAPPSDPQPGLPPLQRQPGAGSRAGAAPYEVAPAPGVR